MADLRINSLTKSFRHTPVLQGIDLAIASGALLAVLGTSGSGKTTLLRLIAGFDQADQGSIMIDGALIASPALHVPPEQRRIGYVPQNAALFPHLTVAQNIGFGAVRATRRDTVMRLLELTGLSPGFARRMPSALSGGERQRVALARALAPAPKLVLLDEPFAALDQGSRTATAAAMMGALATSRSTAILVTHDQAEAFSLGAEIAILRNGRIAQRASPEVLYRNPADLDLARFLGDACILPGFSDQGYAECLFGRLPTGGASALGRVDVLIRPEQIKLVREGSPGSIPARVTRIVYFGADALVHLDAHGVALASRLFNHEIPPPGSETGLRAEGPVMVFPACQL